MYKWIMECSKEKSAKFSSPTIIKHYQRRSGVQNLSLSSYELLITQGVWIWICYEEFPLNLGMCGALQSFKVLILSIDQYSECYLHIM